MPAERAASRGVWSRTPRDAGEAVLDAAVELRDPCRDAGAADGLLHLEGGDGGPLVLVGLEAARGHAPRVGGALHRTIVDPGVVGLLLREGGDEGPEASPGLRAGPDEAGAAGGVDPLVRPGAEEVGAEIGHALVDAAETVDAVDDQEDAVLGVALLVELGEGAGDGADGEPDPGLRVHPGDAHHPGGRLHSGPDAPDDLVDGGLRGIGEEGNLPERRPGALGGVLD